jgi:hypothetical protein
LIYQSRKQVTMPQFSILCLRATPTCRAVCSLWELVNLNLRFSAKEGKKNSE